MMYTVIDVETTGKTNRITEISIFKYDGQKIVDEYTTLVNPEEVIPVYITVLTNIDNTTVANAPVFKDIAQAILDFTKDTIFVAHNVNFDFKMISGEFERIGLSFHREKLCTVRLSRALFKGLPSYSLGKLCKSLDIPLQDRHRARGDAAATVILFQKLLEQDQAALIFENQLNANKTLKNLENLAVKESQINNLPQAIGVFFLYNQNNNVIFVGKSKNIKKTVVSLFNSKKTKDKDLVKQVVNIDYKRSGHEAIAQLMELEAIKKYTPEYNTIKKVGKKTYSLFNYTDRNGIMHFAVNLTKLSPYTLKVFTSQKNAVLFLKQLCTSYNLCPKYCALPAIDASCSSNALSACKGVCEAEEPISVYNTRVNDAVSFIKSKKENNIIKLPGRDLNEDAIILIADGIYKGYGFISKEVHCSNYTNDLEQYITPQEYCFGVQSILCAVE